MRIDHHGTLYKLDFARYLEDGKDGIVTEARLFRWHPSSLDTGAWVPIASGKVRRWISRSGKHVDSPSREEGRRYALKKLTATIDRSLGGAVTHAYYNRPHDPDPKSILRQIAQLQAELLRLDTRRLRDRPTFADAGPPTPDY